tara:strand:+ start:100753 stop:101418 length:666 start_codon:yes stop_codon:yes gene_type:complete
MIRKLLMLEDDRTLGTTLKERLEKEGYEVHWREKAQEGIQLIERFSFDLVILDLGLPDGSGFEVAREVKAKTACPFLFVTAQSDAETRLQAYELGAEEYIPKPFHLKEFLIRVKHVLDNHVPRQIMNFGDFSIDGSNLSITHTGEPPVSLQLKDFKILQLLVSKKKQVVSRDEILDVVWGREQYPSQRTVDNCVVRLRQALKDEKGEIIKSIRGVGYQWER